LDVFSQVIQSVAFDQFVGMTQCCLL
jgi:hypothetical protein